MTGATDKSASGRRAAAWARHFAVVWQLPAWCLIALVRLYQLAISPWLGRNCRFHPTCSQYLIGAVQKYGVLRGSIKGMFRILRCHPWHPGGEDPP
jgi:putative membrane protein insertion efficiency factor